MTTQLHKHISFLKSGIRIGSCIISLCLPITKSVYTLSIGLLVAELLGVIEELRE